MHDVLKHFLELNLPGGKKKKKDKVELGVTDERLGGAINDSLAHVSCVKSKAVAELARGIRLHFPKFIKEFKEGDYEKAQLGLGHSYSRSKVKFNVNRSDNMIIQTINLLDTLNKDLNTFSMRVKYVSLHSTRCWCLLMTRPTHSLKHQQYNPYVSLLTCTLKKGMVFVALPGTCQVGAGQLSICSSGKVPKEQIGS